MPSHSSKRRLKPALQAKLGPIVSSSLCPTLYTNPDLHIFLCITYNIPQCCNMLSSSLPAPFTAPHFSGKIVSSTPLRRVRFRPLVCSANATDAHPTWTEQPMSASYLSLNSTTSSTSLYGILGIPAGASNQEIKAAYRRLARVCHPDAAAVDRKNSSSDEFMKIHAAYSTLSDPEKRADYDRRLFRRQRPLSMGSRFSGYSGRNWETDQCW